MSLPSIRKQTDKVIKLPSTNPHKATGSLHCWQKRKHANVQGTFKDLSPAVFPFWGASVTFSEDIAEAVIPSNSDITSFPLENSSSASPSFPCLALSWAKRSDLQEGGKVRSKCLNCSQISSPEGAIPAESIYNILGIKCFWPRWNLLKLHFCFFKALK